jgi:hypothetical protein
MCNGLENSLALKNHIRLQDPTFLDWVQPCTTPSKAAEYRVFDEFVGFNDFNLYMPLVCHLLYFAS